ncbi:MAG: sulfatase [Verrucomicrobiota bacterium]
MRKTTRTAIAAILGITSSFLAAETASPSPPEHPNIIWLMTEDIGTDLETYGTAGVQTPNLNKLADEGALFTRAYCENPICSPNRSGMMVGVHPSRINAQHHRSNRETPLPEPYKPITYWLRQAGYTCILGSDLVFDRGTKIDCNFRHEPTGDYDGITEFGLFDKIGDFTQADQPFFNQIQLKITHRGDWWKSVREASENPVSLDEIELPPYMADTPETRYDWAAYLDTIEFMDNEVGLILQRLKDEGIEQNTIIIFIADNGRCNLRGKGFLHQPGIHIPMIIWAPDHFQGGTVVEELVSTTDISATILQLAGIPLPDYMTARPFMGVDEPEYRTYVRSARDIWDEIDEASRSITTNRYKYILNLMPEVPWDTDHAYLELNRPSLHVMRQLKAGGKLTDPEMTFFHETKPVEELYDLEIDPNEMVNLAEDPAYRETLEQMRAYEQDWRSQYQDFGLEDLGQREPEAGLRSVRVRQAVKEKAPELWERLEAGELMQTQAWKEYLNAPKKN